MRSVRAISASTSTANGRRNPRGSASTSIGNRRSRSAASMGDASCRLRIHVDSASYAMPSRRAGSGSPRQSSSASASASRASASRIANSSALSNCSAAESYPAGGQAAAAGSASTIGSTHARIVRIGFPVESRHGTPRLCNTSAPPLANTCPSMPLNPTRKAFLQIHFCVVLWGFTAILGKMISLPALPLVWWRLLIVVAALALVLRVGRGPRAMPPRLMLAYAGIGALVALHWLTFYGAIKLSNASVGATCIALGTVFVAMLEPWLTRTRFSKRELALGVLVLPGVVLVVGGVPAGMRAGIAVGAVSALLVAVFGSLNKRWSNTA